MKKYVFIFGVILSFALFSAPYKPYPILFVHGLGSNSKTWGVKCDSIPSRQVWKGTQFYTDSMVQILDSPNESPTFKEMIRYMKPYAIAWEDIDTTYTIPGENAYPNKSFLEVVNMDDPWGSV